MQVLERHEPECCGSLLEGLEGWRASCDIGLGRP